MLGCTLVQAVGDSLTHKAGLCLGLQPVAVNRVSYLGDAKGGYMLFQIRGENEAALLHLVSSQFYVIGSSVKTSARAGESVSTLAIYPEKGKEGVLALAKADENEVTLVRVTWKDEKFSVSDGSYGKGQFFDPNHVVQLYGGDSKNKSWMEIEIGKRRFTTNPNRPGMYYVKDPSLLCRYLVGQASKPDVIHAAVETRVEQRKIQAMEAELEYVRASVHKWKNHALNLSESTLALLKRDQEVEESRDQWKHLAQRLADRLHNKFFLSAKDRAVLNDPLIPDYNEVVETAGQG